MLRVEDGASRDRVLPRGRRAVRAVRARMPRTESSCACRRSRTTATVARGRAAAPRTPSVAVKDGLTRVESADPLDSLRRSVWATTKPGSTRSARAMQGGDVDGGGRRRPSSSLSTSTSTTTRRRISRTRQRVPDEVLADSTGESVELRRHRPAGPGRDDEKGSRRLQSSSNTATSARTRSTTWFGHAGHAGGRTSTASPASRTTGMWLATRCSVK